MVGGSKPALYVHLLGDGGWGELRGRGGRQLSCSYLTHGQNRYVRTRLSHVVTVDFYEK